MRTCTSSPRRFAAVALGAAFFLIHDAMAERAEDFGEYQIHYNALTTDLIEPSIARAYGIIRSKNRALINVAVLRRVMGMATQPVKATIKAEAVNLSAQLRTLEMRELNDAGAIYYIGEIPVSHNETLNFKLVVTPEGGASGHTIEFKEEFYTE
jgi:hypothetical protein